MKSSVLRSVKLNPSYTPRSGISLPEAISPTVGGFHPSGRTDLVEKPVICLPNRGLFLARLGGFEPSTYRFVAGHSIH